MNEALHSKNPRMSREAKTVKAMVAIYCHDNHDKAGDKLCAECQGLYDYAMLRLSKCPFQEGKTTCGNCRVHCYKPEMRDRIKLVMRYSGPKMANKHLVMAIYHIFDSRRKEPLRRPNKQS